MSKFIWIALVSISGALLPLQTGLNAKMGKSVANPIWASIISFAVGMLGLLIYAAVTKQSFSLAGAKQAPGYLWTAGLLGAFYVTVSLLAFPKLGPALTFGLLVAGQLFISLMLDHFNVLVQAQHSINIYRIIGMLLIVAGVVIIRKF